MSATPLSMLPLGTPLPEFSLTNAVDGRMISSTALDGRKGVLVMFIGNHCPYVAHIRSRLVEVAHQAIRSGVAVVAINSNSAGAQREDGSEEMKQVASTENWRFPYLCDEGRAVARAFQAAYTPNFFVFDAQRTLVYHGQFDDARPGTPTEVTGRDLGWAIEAVVLGKRPLIEQAPSFGSQIRWHPPDRFGIGQTLKILLLLGAAVLVGGVVLLLWLIGWLKTNGWPFG